ncbi:hypothetical protein ATANTOWER_018464 [Ataeniobius toweri]|uniref:NADH dehydrogenase subunit 6 n=1 Tax=Ataeniobius toweri TaxID=208326 RepID=A0ABU7AQ68_9TELE|nr:hypothetical protein [Ataeniobius toweri]
MGVGHVFLGLDAVGLLFAPSFCPSLYGVLWWWSYAAQLGMLCVGAAGQVLLGLAVALVFSALYWGGVCLFAGGIHNVPMDVRKDVWCRWCCGIGSRGRCGLAWLYCFCLAGLNVGGSASQAVAFWWRPWLAGPASCPWAWWCLPPLLEFGERGCLLGSARELGTFGCLWLSPMSVSGPGGQVCGSSHSLLHICMEKLYIHVTPWVPRNINILLLF